MAGLINKEDELARLAKEVAKIEGEISRIENKLANEGFVARAPEAVIAKEREKLEGYAEAKAKLIEQRLLSPRCNTHSETKAGACSGLLFR